MAPAGQVTKDFTLARVNITIGAHAVVQRLKAGQSLLLARDLKDPFDPEHAIMVVAADQRGRHKIGYLPMGLAKELAPLMDRGLNVIARKAPNSLYGVCQVAYLPPAKEPVIVSADVPDEPTGLNIPAETPVAIELPNAAEIEAKLLAAKGVTQADLDDAADLPPLGDSRRLVQKDDPDDEPTSDPTD